MKKRILCIALCIVLLAGLCPVSVLAAPGKTVDEVRVTGFTAPKIGEQVRFIPSDTLSTPAGEPYTLVLQTSYWRDEHGDIIYGPYAFETGMTYRIQINFKLNDPAYSFSNKCRGILEGIDSGSYTTECEISGGNLVMTFLFTMPGVYNPQPISRVDLSGGPIEDSKRIDWNPTMAYNHAYFGGIHWDGATDGDVYKGGTSYTVWMNIKDYEGVGFAPTGTMVFTYNATEYPATFEILDKETLHIQTRITVPKVNEIYEIRAIGLKSAPIDGTNANTFAWGDIHSFVGAPYMATEISPKWMDARGNPLPDGTKFAAGQQYCFDVAWHVTGVNENKFSSSVRCTLNGFDEKDYQVLIRSWDREKVVVRYVLTAQTPPGEPIYTINVHGIDVPRPNVKADYDALVYDPGYQVSSISWYNNTDNHDLYIPNHDHLAGKEYSVTVTLQAREGFEFKPAGYLNATVNGQKAQILTADKNTCQIRYFFGSCNTGILRQVDVWNLEAPVAGNAADFSVNCGDFYRVTSSNSDYNNGIGWYDMTDARYLEYGETFLAGHQYMVEMDILANPGYQFFFISGTLNGELVTALNEDYTREGFLTCIFPACPAEEALAIRTVELADIDIPQPGKTGDTTATLSDSSCTVSSIVWYDTTDRRTLGSGEAFQSNHGYQVWVYLAAAEFYQFAPDAQVTVNARKADCFSDGSTAMVIFTFPPLYANPFTDLNEKAFYYDAVLWAVSNGITTGMTPTTFVPDGPCVRGQAVTFLWRSIASPAAPAVDNPFSDVAQGRYYYEPVLWAVGNNITNGMTPTTFVPDSQCTRGQIVTFLWRLFGKPQATGTNPFTDVNANAYYYQAVLWAVEKGITNGTSATTFNPDGNCTRGQIVTFLYRAVTN